MYFQTNGYSLTLSQKIFDSLAVPPTNRVSLGIPVDNTVGTAVLTADDVWNAQTSAMNTPGSIGKRLKNASTVDSTGDQLTSLL
jgi:hypothetical protein